MYCACVMYCARFNVLCPVGGIILFQCTFTKNFHLVYVYPRTQLTHRVLKVLKEDLLKKRQSKFPFYNLIRFEVYFLAAYIQKIYSLFNEKICLDWRAHWCITCMDFDSLLLYQLHYTYSAIATASVKDNKERKLYNVPRP